MKNMTVFLSQGRRKEGMRKDVLEVRKKERHKIFLQRCGKRCCGQHQWPLAAFMKFKGELSMCLL